MDETSKKILDTVGIPSKTETSLNGYLIPREILINETLYDSIKDTIPELRTILSSSSLTSLQKTAQTAQKWPLLNLIRQILHSYKFKMVPIRKSDGYTKEGVKKYRRFFMIEKKYILENQPEKVL